MRGSRLTCGRQRSYSHTVVRGSVAAAAASKKTVAIIGAGPAGLVAAKSAIAAGLEPTVYDRHDSVGGMWSPAGEVWSSLRTNLSRFTVSFSDFPWSRDAPMFPSQGEVNAYLRDYASTFLDPATVRLNTEVKSVARVDGSATWQLRSASGGQEQQELYDHVVVASGFFSAPYAPPVQGAGSLRGPVLHSCSYRSPQQLGDARTVVVAGASFSATEVAAELAAAGLQVLHVAPRPFWVLPRHIPADPSNPSSPFLPVDVALYRRPHPPHAAPAAPALLDGSTYAKTHDLLRTVCGGDQGTMLDPQLSMPRDGPQFVSVSDTYPVLVRAGRIKLQMGRVQGVSATAVTLHDGTQLEGVDALVLCTGYSTRLPFLDPALLEQLSYQPSDQLAPLLLHRNVLHPAVPGMAFVGMYRGPHFPVMELQARWVADMFSGKRSAPPVSEQAEGVAREAAVRALQPRPQFPYVGYLALADALAADLGLLLPEEWRVRNKVVTAAQYSGSTALAESVAAEVAAMEGRALAGHRVAGAVFRGLQGSWVLRRQLTSFLVNLPSGTVTGTAEFALTAPGVDEYLYSEQGTFVLGSGASMSVHKQYVYSYSEPQDELSVHFAVGGKRDSFFHSLGFLPAPPAGEQQGGWRAQGYHLCSRDAYQSFYRFAFQGLQLAEFEIKFVVKGPEKDYTSVAVYRRA